LKFYEKKVGQRQLEPNQLRRQPPDTGDQLEHETDQLNGFLQAWWVATSLTGQRTDRGSSSGYQRTIADGRETEIKSAAIEVSIPKNRQTDSNVTATPGIRTAEHESSVNQRTGAQQGEVRSSS